MDPIMLTVALAVLFVALIYHWATRNFNYWKDREIEFIPPVPFLGSIWSVLTLREHMGQFFWRMYDKYKGDHQFVGYFQSNSPGLIVTDPELVRSIMIKDFSHFVDHGFEIDEEVDPMQSRNLFNMEGQKWKDMRSKLSPTFTSGKIKGLFPLVETCAKNFENYMRDHQRENINIKDLLARYTTDIIGSCAFGLPVDSIKNPEDKFRVMGRKIFDIDLIQGLKNACIFFLPKVTKFFRFTFFPMEVTQFFRKLVKDIIDQRKKSGNTRKDFMQLLIQLKEHGKVAVEEGETEELETHEPSSIENLTDDDIVAQAVVFFIAGFETSSSMLTFGIMEMARHPDVQQRARDNIEEVLSRHGGKLSYQALQEMTYLDWIIQEALRMFPPLPIMNRVCTKNYVIPGTKTLMEKGTLVVIPTWAMQNDPKYFENPRDFYPDRYEDENLLKNNFVYMPFGEGPRQCIGMRFAKMQSKLGLYSILRHFEILESPKTAYPPVWDPKLFLLSATNDIFIQLKSI
ncbi:cytochrome P450 6a2-like [Neocloeon triangulifer]|uniref:cytochrome P450 6a2-like n=1 Tax=Neocloeon triangulifer TaxID=2078957 RepID=UPI00286F67B3|nr:cytochrome P450 6a2-like [Neocloeon triangulifer]